MASEETVIRNKSVKLVGNVFVYDGSPDILEVFWTKNGEKIDTQGSGGRLSTVTVDDPSLTIRDPCSLKLSERLQQYSIAFYVMASLACLLECEIHCPGHATEVEAFRRVSGTGKLKKASEEQMNENQDTSEVEEKEQNELSQISTTEDMNGTVLEENQDEKSEKIEKKKRRRGGKVKPISDIPNPVQRPLSKLPPLQMQHNKFYPAGRGTN
uniref:Uncharacterized protein n=1 Tax=Magallana gigas TaxID=29159 RepID=K1PUA3_MAGGI